MMKSGLETLKATLPKIHGQPHSVRMLPDNAVEDWETVADQFALHVHKVRLFQVPEYSQAPNLPYRQARS
jgi:hypothetical protein